LRGEFFLRAAVKVGSVKRVPIEHQVAEVLAEDAIQVMPNMEALNVAPPVAPKESDLYEPMASVIKDQWAQDYRMDQMIVEITALAGSKIYREMDQTGLYTCGLSNLSLRAR
jgi:hypothetical protein